MPFITNPFEMVIVIVAIGCGTALIAEVFKAMQKRGASVDALEAYEKRLARVEVAIDDLTVAIGRVTEGQQFLTNVLTERGAVAALPRRE
jgi:precorrin-6B methylase 2